jgi:hypothetical protein
VATNSTAPDGNFAPVPSAIRSDYCLDTNAYAYGGAQALFSIFGNADLPLEAGVDDGVFVQGTGNAPDESETSKFTSLAGLAYPAAGTAWHSLTLLNGWINGKEFAVVGDVDGAAVGPTVLKAAGFRLPEGRQDRRSRGLTRVTRW